MSDVTERPKLHQPFLLDDPERVVRRARLRRRLRVVVVAGALVLVATVTAYALVWDWSREQSYVRVLHRDLARLAEAQQRHRARTGDYGDRDALGVEFVPSQAVWVDVQVQGTTWRATARHERVETECWVESTGGVVGAVECG